ncbi:MAG: GNAT family N-acetyltransferase [Rhizobiaceae bacterium]
MNRFQARIACQADADVLADIRVEAMRSSLEAVGRFDPDRARQRFLSDFTPTDTKIIQIGGQTVGFYVLRHRRDHLYLDHLYIQPAHQGGGLGRMVVDQLQRQARKEGLPIKLMALKQSPANGFYQSSGFVLLSSDELDNHYLWLPH